MTPTISESKIYRSNDMLNLLTNPQIMLKYYDSKNEYSNICNKNTEVDIRYIRSNFYKFCHEKRIAENELIGFVFLRGKIDFYTTGDTDYD